LFFKEEMMIELSIAIFVIGVCPLTALALSNAIIFKEKRFTHTFIPFFAAALLNKISLML